MRRLLLAISALVLAACDAPADYWGDEAFTVQEREEIEDGFTWLASQAHRPPPSISWQLERSAEVLPHTIRRELGPTDNIPATGECKAGTIYLWPEARPEINAPPATLPGLAAHELAHCWLGFVDDKGGAGLMGTPHEVWGPFEEAECARTGCRPAETEQ